MFPVSIQLSNSILLSAILAMPFFGAVLLFFVPRSQVWLSRFIATAAAVGTLVYSLILLISFNPQTAEFQFTELRPWYPEQGISYALGVDGISLWLVLLTAFLSLIVIIASGSVTKNLRAYLGAMLFLETGMLGAFMALDGILFYVFWELMLVPMYFLIGVWGGERRLYAAIKFVLFTAFGSLLMLVAIVYLGYQHQLQFGSWSFAIGDWTKLHFTANEQLLLFGAFALAFAIKVPIFPFHTWLPDAHVEAPTGGSVILAGVLLKFGLYGLIRFGMPVFPSAVVTFAPLFLCLGLVGIVYGALMAWVQDDIKKLIAYSSVSHLGFCVIGFAALNFEGMQGALLQMINHGISTGALFLIVGVLYDRKHTRKIEDYRGLSAQVPRFAFVYMVFTLSSIGLPLTNGFIGEFLIMLGGFKASAWVGGIAVTGVILGAVYMLSLYRRVMYGELNTEKNGDLTDLSSREKVIFAPLLVLVFVIGLFPQVFLSKSEESAKYYVNLVQKVQVDQEHVNFDPTQQEVSPGE